MNPPPLKVLIVGGGNIAGRFDMKRSRDDAPLTHAGAYSRDSRFTIAACVEPDDQRRAEFLATWGIANGYRSMDEIDRLDNQFDIISICSPTPHHAKDLVSALHFQPKLIFCEKPVTASLPESAALVARCKEAGVKLAVNYTRRWDPDVSRLAADIESGHWGPLRSASGIYNKGILNNGSHMLDILNRLAGPLSLCMVGKPVFDYSQDDPSIPFWLEGAQGQPIHITCGHADDFAFFELQLVFSRGVLTMEDGGMYWRERHAESSSIFKGYRTLDSGNRYAGEYPRSMLNALDNLYHAITGSHALASTGESALATQRLCEEVKRTAFDNIEARKRTVQRT